MNNKKIADMFDQVADLLEFQGANPFRLRAYRNGARTIRDLTEPVRAMVEESRDLTDLEGVGKDLAAKIIVIVETGELPMLNDLLAEVPKTVLDLLRVPGLGPKKAATVHKELGIDTLDQLKAACQAAELRHLKGFGAKTEQAILAGIEIAAAANKRMLWANADVIAQELLAHLSSCSTIEKIDMAGSYRRLRETVGDLDILVVSTDATEVMDRLAEFDDVDNVIGRGDTKMSVRLTNGLQVDLRVVPRRSFGAALQYFTGSKDHNVIVRGLAKKKGLRVNEYGVYKTNGNSEEPEFVAGETEQDVYAALGLPLFPPELREARGEFDFAKQDALPELIQLEDIVGDLHMHTTATDGKASIREMVEAAKARGLKYIAITDHSKRVSMANGLDDARLMEQWDEVDRINEELDKSFTLLKGIECDILESGGMDISDEVLARADWVLASVHYGQRQSRDQITQRIIGAVENPHVCAIAHPTGRLINKREAYEVDIDAVFLAVKENDKLLELNANPRRLDLHDTHCAIAKRAGIPIVINTDAHSVEGLDVMCYGIQQARRAGLTKNDVANTKSWAQVKKLMGK